MLRIQSISFRIRGGKFSQSERRISDAHEFLVHLAKNYPVVALPVHDGWQWYEREIAKRNFQRARSQSELGGGATNRLQTCAVGRCVTELPNSCETYLASEMMADHSQTCRPTIHFIDLQDVIDFWDSLASLSK